MKKKNGLSCHHRNAGDSIRSPRGQRKFDLENGHLFIIPKRSPANHAKPLCFFFVWLRVRSVGKDSKDRFQQCWMIQGVNFHECEVLRWRVQHVSIHLKNYESKMQDFPKYIGVKKLMNTNTMCNHQVIYKWHCYTLED